MALRSPAVLPLLFAALGSPALADTHVVDATGGGDFLTVQGALAAAQDGDLVLLESGTYVEPLVVDGIGLIVAAAPLATVVVRGDAVIRNVPFGASVTVAGLEVSGALHVDQCLGAVLLEDCTFPRPLVPRDSSLPPTQSHLFGRCGIGDVDRRITDSVAVSITASTFEGAHGAQGTSDGHPGWHALGIARSNVALFDCILDGGDGGDALGTLPPVYPGSGGDGVRVLEEGSRVTLARVAAQGGTEGVDVSFGTTLACAGRDVRANRRNAVERALHPDLALRAPQVAVGGSSARIEIEGPPGATILLVHAHATEWRPLGPSTGTLLTGGVLRLLPLGTIPASGLRRRLVLPPAQPTVEDHVEILYQVVAFTSSGRFVSEPRSISVISSLL